MEKQLIIVLLTTLFFSFFNLGKDPIQSFDEARHCATAIEMIQNSDWFNYYYVGVPDTWNAKPPLGIWAIVLSMKTFGYNAFALRFPSAIATLFIFLFSYKLIRLFEAENFALICCLMMLSVKGIIGTHVGRTGDFDALLLCFLMIGFFYFVKFMLENKNLDLIISAIGFGLAFWVKGPAMMVLFPGILLFLVFSKQLALLLKKKITWISLLVMLIFPMIYLLNMQFVGNEFEEVKYVGTNSVETLFLYDIVERFTNDNFEEGDFKNSWDFFPIFLDTKFNLWNYIFYFAISLLIFRKLIPEKFRPRAIVENHLLLLSISIWFSLGFILTLLNGQRLWYLAPCIPFIAITTYYGIQKICEENKIGFYLLVSLLMFTLIRQAYQIYTVEDEKPIISKLKSLDPQIETIYLPQTNLEQDVIANAYLLDKKMSFENEVEMNKPLQKGELLLLSTYQSTHNRKRLKSINQVHIIGNFELYYSVNDAFSN